MNNLNNSHMLRQLIVYIVRNLSLLDRSEASCCQLTLAQCNAIVEIGRAEEIYLNKLAEVLRLDKSTMSRTVDNLVKQNYVIREVDEENRRFIKIKLSEKGKQLFTATEEKMEHYYKNIYEAIDEDKREQVLESLDILLQALKRNNCC